VSAGRPVTIEREVLAGAFYVARFTPDWPARPFWILRRCVVPYVAVGQFLLLAREGVPVAFAGWVYEREGERKPWREHPYLPSAADLSRCKDGGRCLVTELISPILPVERVIGEVGRALGLRGRPAWMELDAERKPVAFHEESDK